MNAEEIGKAIDRNYPDVYATTYAPTTLYLKNGTIKVGFFAWTEDSDSLKRENIFTFVEFGENAQGYRATSDKKYITKIRGEDLIKVEHPQIIVVKFDQIFKINLEKKDATPVIPIRIGGVTMGPGVSFGNGLQIGGINLYNYKGQTVKGYIDNGVFVIMAFNT